jgi:predicted nucleic-acid-binding Zn-ribbon protein
MNHDFRCPKCQNEMAQGFIPDAVVGGVVVGYWAEGQPMRAFFGGLKNAPNIGGIPIGAFRCVKCGYLEFYADQKYAAQ